MKDIRDILRALPHTKLPPVNQLGYSDPDLTHQDWFNADNGYPMYVKAAETIQPTQILEIGSFYGFGLCAFHYGAEDSLRQVISVDNESYVANSQSFARANFVDFVFGEDLLSNETDFDYAFYTNRNKIGPGHGTDLNEWLYRDGADEQKLLIHVDGDHSYDGALMDMAWAWSLSPDVMLVDDYRFIPEVKNAVGRFASHFNLQFHVWDSFRGWAVFARDLDSLPEKL